MTEQNDQHDRGLFLANVPSHLPRTVGTTDAGSEATKHAA